MTVMALDKERTLADRIVESLPANEEDLALMLGTTREQIASSCTLLHRQRRIKLDRSWDAPRCWKKA